MSYTDHRLHYGRKTCSKPDSQTARQPDSPAADTTGSAERSLLSLYSRDAAATGADAVIWGIAWRCTAGFCAAKCNSERRRTNTLLVWTFTQPYLKPHLSAIAGDYTEQLPFLLLQQWELLP